MKTHLNTLLITFLVNFGFAQNSINPIRDSINYVFAELDTNSIPSGVLYEKASPSLNWSYFSGKNDSLTNISILKGMYKVLRNGSVHESNNFISDDSLNDLFSEARNADLISVPTELTERNSVGTGSNSKLQLIFVQSVKTPITV